MIKINDIIVSVVMPTYNGSKYIKRAIDSILVQTYEEFEFIIVDDGSSDNTANIINAYKDNRIKYIFQENKGPVFAYNRGFKEAKGDYIFIMDHDDYSYPSRIEKQLKCMKENKLEICGSFFMINNEDNAFVEKKRLPTDDQNIKKEILYKPITLFNPTLCIRKTVFNKFGLFDEQIIVGYDYSYLLRVSAAVKCGNVSDYLYIWTRHKNSFGSVYSVQGREIYRNIAIKNLDSYSVSLKRNEILYIKGMIYYYSNCFSKSALYFLKCIRYGYIKYRVFFYLFLVTLLFPIVIYLRKNNLFSHPLVVRLKNLLIR